MTLTHLSWGKLSVSIKGAAQRNIRRSCSTQDYCLVVGIRLAVEGRNQATKLVLHLQRRVSLIISANDRRPSFEDVINFVWSRDMLRVEGLQQVMERIT